MDTNEALAIADSSTEASTTKTGLEVLADIVIDHATGLMWTRDNVQGEYDTFAKFESAAKACRAGGFDDWQVPERHELTSLLDLSRFDPCINTDAFPNCEAGAYWSKTPCAFNASFVWVVYFYSGGVNYFHRDGYCAFGRAVRRVSASQ